MKKKELAKDPHLERFVRWVASAGIGLLVASAGQTPVIGSQVTEKVLWQGYDVAAVLSENLSIRIMMMVEPLRRRIQANGAQEDCGSFLHGPVVTVTPDAEHILSITVLRQTAVKNFLMIEDADSEGRTKTTHLSHGPMAESIWQCVELDGQDLYRAENIGWLSWCPSAAAPAFVAKKTGEYEVVVGRKVVEKGGPFIELRTTADGAKFAYARHAGARWEVVHNGKPLASFEWVKHIQLSPHGNHVAYAAKRGDRWVVQWDGQAVAEAEDIGALFVPGHTRKTLLLVAKHDDGWYIETADGKYGPVGEVSGCPTVRFSPDGSMWAAVVKKGMRKFLVVTGQEKCELPAKPALFELWGGFATYCRALSDFAYQRHSKGGWLVVAGSQTFGPFAKPLDLMDVSPDGSTIAGCTYDKLFVDNAEVSGNWLLLIPSTLHFVSNDAIRLAGYKVGPPAALCSWTVMLASKAADSAPATRAEIQAGDLREVATPAWPYEKLFEVMSEMAMAKSWWGRQLERYKGDGSVGENRLGYVEERPCANMSDPQYATYVRLVIQSCNSDRRKVYDEFGRGGKDTPEKIGSGVAAVIRERAKEGHWIEVPVGEGWVWKAK